MEFQLVDRGRVALERRKDPDHGLSTRYVPDLEEEQWVVRVWRNVGYSTGDGKALDEGNVMSRGSVL